MTPEIRRAALRAAAKTALVVSIGCSSPSKPAPEPASPSNVAPPTAQVVPASCDEYLAGLARVSSSHELATDDPLRDQPAVYAAFSDVTLRSSARTKDCCTEALVRDGTHAKQRFECCSALGDVPEKAEPSACTPWGPPCPPELV